MDALEEDYKERAKNRDPAAVKAVEEVLKMLADIDAEEAKMEGGKDEGEKRS